MATTTRWRWRAIAGVVAIGAALVLPVIGRAQPQPRMVALEGEGKVDAVAPDGVAATINGNLFILSFAPDAAVAVRGPASRECLVPGTPVGFTVELDEKGKPSGEVERISLHAGGQPGVHAENEPSGKKPTRRRTAGPHHVVGLLKGVTPDGEYTVVAGTDRLAIKLAADAIVEVDSPNLALAGKGDMLAVTGSYAQPDVQPGQPLPPLQAQVRQLTITLAKPLEPKGKKRPLKPPSRKQPAAGE